MRATLELQQREILEYKKNEENEQDKTSLEEPAFFSLNNGSNQNQEVTTTLPFFPARCGLCGEVHFEALCPICASTSTAAATTTTNSVQNAYGVVSRIYHPHQQKQQQETKPNFNNNSSNFVVAMIQPHGTAGRNSMVLLPSSALPSDGSSRQRILSVGSFVRFDAQRSSISLRPHERSKHKQNVAEAGIVSFTKDSNDTTTTTSALCVTKISAVS